MIKSCQTYITETIIVNGMIYIIDTIYAPSAFPLEANTLNTLYALYALYTLYALYALYTLNALDTLTGRFFPIITTKIWSIINIIISDTYPATTIIINHISNKIFSSRSPVSFP
ncbi:MAG: hypothetical protein EBS49_02565 [Verrucomicrobia bacterium]|nr:hypothetical protein [Verrucomicrobiota bacterium]